MNVGYEGVVPPQQMSEAEIAYVILLGEVLDSRARYGDARREDVSVMMHRLRRCYPITCAMWQIEMGARSFDELITIVWTSFQLPEGVRFRRSE